MWREILFWNSRQHYCCVGLVAFPALSYHLEPFIFGGLRSSGSRYGTIGATMAKLITFFIAVAIVHSTFGAVLPRGNKVYTLPIRRSFARASSLSRRVMKQTSVSVTYGSGSFSGTEFSDTVTISPGLVVQSQSIGVASSSQGFTDCDGILGLGPVDLTLGTLSPSTGSTVPTVVDNLFSQGTIPSNVFSLSFEPSTSLTSTNGEITFGGTDSTKYTGSIAYAPITATSPARDFWGVDGSFRYAGAVIDKATGLPKLTSAQFAKLKSLFVTIGGTTLELTANACIFPWALNIQIGGEAGGIYLAFGDLGSNSGAGLDFVLGLTFLERFYSVYDADNKRVGFATTRFTHANTN
ncbi:acid protease [Basidiobolus meristosporus CBS 931.73]|uniref:Acid protease n=1 Tax=Basidiobolus meristosporus CBS 931.73 TaxID=1314790 RepID=A0A1Y1XZP5_9FUNG|nr:acid protease [Basidiobolus meristosporus CBS 931.73]|eukprot:ORX91209.1 acid protease [Basidiobolus meristosporus CBS 931.73]